ncbi:hypothetical protein [Capnocytophaga sputigena]|uniref:Uncharacterized protein n=1 Tax=Capnocytophaga sputigena TaxID=1019 RepID=A0AAX2I8F7_CAPSP|nr:hypothetical protein [Capnocytophaga sputigena]ATA83304.1 hypothetical protein CGC55_01745 [Capnocytophaga sputigena]EEB65959.1 hypothetical protein CAPSP0001_1920 [Capnocytophaga sputigena ATCC 33612]SQA74268.1 Uncharacterised protein [Capnocytophaga sputigena]
MEKNFYDLELIKILEEHIEDGDFQIISSDIYVDKVNANLPFVGSRVDFELLDEYQRMFFDENEAIVAFVKSIAMEAGIAPDEKVVYLGDNVSNLTYIFSFKYLEKVIVDILDNIPEHHYFLSERMKWILYISYEDCAEFALI